MMVRNFRMAPGMNLKMIEEARLGPSVRPLKQDVVGDVGKVLWILMATVGIVLLITCANVANFYSCEPKDASRSSRFAQRWERAGLKSPGNCCWKVRLSGLSAEHWAWRSLHRASLGRGDGPRKPAAPGRNFNRHLGAALHLAISLLPVCCSGSFPLLNMPGPTGTTLREGGRTTSDGRERHRARTACSSHKWRWHSSC